MPVSPKLSSSGIAAELQRYLQRKLRAKTRSAGNLQRKSVALAGPRTAGGAGRSGGRGLNALGPERGASPVPGAGSTALRQRLRLVVAGDVGAAIEDPGVALCDGAVKRREFRIEIAGRPRLEHEKVMAILAAHMGGTVLAGELRHRRRNIPMAEPMRRSCDGFGGEPWTRRTWYSDISAGRRVMTRRWERSTSAITSWPRVKRLCLAKVSR